MYNAYIVKNRNVSDYNSTNTIQNGILLASYDMYLILSTGITV